MNLLNRLFDGPVLGKTFCSCAPSPPPTPDYKGAAIAQGQASVDAARTTGKLNNPTVISPYGTQTVTYGGGFDQAGYDKAMQAYDASKKAQGDAWRRWDAGGRSGAFNDPGVIAAPDRNRFITGDPDQVTVNQTWAPELKELFDSGNRAKKGLSDLAVQGTDLARGVLDKSLDFSALPARPGSAEDTRTKVLNAMMGRVNEDANRQERLLQSDLAARGISTNSDAYRDAMALEGRKRTDAANQAYLASGQEMTRDFQTDTQRRRDALAEMLTQRQTPINEITALMSGSQVQNPFSTPGFAQNAQVQAAPLFAAQNMLGDYNTDLYNARAAQAGNLQSGLFGLGGAGIGAAGMMMSDRRLKSNVKRLGTHSLGIGWYEYDIFGQRAQGVMADELEPLRPDAVMTHPNGYKMVDYRKIGDGYVLGDE